MNRLVIPVNSRIPAEWEKHQATWIVWPHQRADWPGKFSAIPWVYVEIIRHLHFQEKIKVLIDSLKREKRVRKMLFQAKIDLEKIEFHRVLTDRGWLRDSGPMFIKYGRSESGKLGILNWRFNGWAKYSDWKKDNAVPKKIAYLLGVKQWQPHNYKNRRAVVMEGGSIEVNGKGTLMTTEECLLSSSQMRNLGLSRSELEQVFKNLQSTVVIGIIECRYQHNLIGNIKIRITCRQTLSSKKKGIWHWKFNYAQRFTILIRC